MKQKTIIHKAYLCFVHDYRLHHFGKVGVVLSLRDLEPALQTLQVDVLDDKAGFGRPHHCNGLLVGLEQGSPGRSTGLYRLPPQLVEGHGEGTSHNGVDLVVAAVFPVKYSKEIGGKF